MSYSHFVARLVTRNRGLVWLAVGLLASLCFYVLVSRLTLDTEVLNLLPGKFQSVQGLKVYNNDFAQTRELTFALSCQPNDVDKLEAGVAPGQAREMLTGVVQARALFVASVRKVIDLGLKDETEKAR